VLALLVFASANLRLHPEIVVNYSETLPKEPEDTPLQQTLNASNLKREPGLKRKLGAKPVISWIEEEIEKNGASFRTDTQNTKKGLTKTNICGKSEPQSLC